MCDTWTVKPVTKSNAPVPTRFVDCSLTYDKHFQSSLVHKVSRFCYKWSSGILLLHPYNSLYNTKLSIVIFSFPFYLNVFLIKYDLCFFQSWSQQYILYILLYISVKFFEVLSVFISSGELHMNISSCYACVARLSIHLVPVPPHIIV